MTVLLAETQPVKQELVSTAAVGVAINTQSPGAAPVTVIVSVEEESVAVEGKSIV